MQPKRMVVQTALAGSQTPVRASQKGLLLNGLTVLLGKEEHTVDKLALTPGPTPKSRGNVQAPVWSPMLDRLGKREM